MWEYNPQLKIIVLLRNPITRAYSHWNMERSREADNCPFWEAIHHERERCREALPLQHRVYSYIDRGFYCEQIRRLWTYFGTERVLILRSEDLKRWPKQALQTVCEFLSVDNMPNADPKDVHSRPYVDSIAPREKDYMRSIFEFEIRELERMLNWNCNDWLAD
jgi:hypothetical protein